VFDPARIERLRRGDSDEDDRDGARYLVDELKSAIVRGARSPTGSHGTRYRTLLVATTERLGLRLRLPHDSLGALVKAEPKLLGTPSLLGNDVIDDMFYPLLEALDSPRDRQLFDAVGPPLTLWEQLDAEVEQLRRDAASASTGHDRAAVGRLCRELFVSLADAAYDETRHGPIPPPVDGEGGGTVTKRLDAVIAAEAGGRSLEDLRGLMRKGLGLANNLQHRKNPSDTEAMICADATILVVSAVRRLTARG
jgi:hypothetical protein